MHLWGHHRPSGPRSGRVKRRATPTELMTARVFRACVRQNVFFGTHMNVNVPDRTRGKPKFWLKENHGGIQLAVDITLRSAVRPAKPPTCSRPRFSGPVASTPGQGSDMSRTRFFGTMQARRAHHGDGWQVEGGGHADLADARRTFGQFDLGQRVYSSRRWCFFDSGQKKNLTEICSTQAKIPPLPLPSPVVGKNNAIRVCVKASPAKDSVAMFFLHFIIFSFYHFFFFLLLFVFFSP